jgi:hypothetical protein
MVATFKERRLHVVYIGPDTLMPLASGFAAVAGSVLMFWRRLIAAFKLLVQRVPGRQSQSAD